eukprot:3678803-Pleurochrysis_carterae.AAC.1
MLAGGTGRYEPIKIWINPNDERDFLVMTKLATQQAREAEFEELAGHECIVTSEGGHCQRDAVKAVE